MKHSLKNTKNLLSRVSAHKRKIAFLLAIAIIIPYFSQIFMKWQERKEFLKQQTSVKKVIFNVFKDLDKQIYRRLLGEN